VKAQGGAALTTRFDSSRVEGVPCVDFACRFGKKCSKLHNAPYSEAMLKDWLTPGNLKAQNKLREAAVEV
jgi:hypothetical protein